MDLERIQAQLERFIVFSGESRPGIGALLLLGAVVVIAWVIPVVVRPAISLVLAVLRAAVAAVATLSTVVAACVVLAVFVVTG